MSDTSPHKRFQFGIHDLLIYTFGVAVMISFFRCDSIAAVLVCWAALLVFMICFRDVPSSCIHILGFVGVLLLAAYVWWRDPESADLVRELVAFGAKACGSVSFVSFHFFLLTNAFQLSWDAGKNCTIVKCSHCRVRISMERRSRPTKETCPSCGNEFVVRPQMSAGQELSCIFIVLALILVSMFLLFLIFL